MRVILAKVKRFVAKHGAVWRAEGLVDFPAGEVGPAHYYRNRPRLVNPHVCVETTRGTSRFF